MVVKIRYDYLLFVGLSLEQIEDVEYHADNCTIVKDESGGVQVRGKHGALYELLFKLCNTYDIELL